ncbi:MAG TPA: hypothetical protein VGM72_06255 [Micropepsaceae bacterium]|jgi:hypothetical protein
MATSSKSPKKQTRKKHTDAEAAAESVGSVVRRIIADESPVLEDWPENWPENWTADLIRRVLAWQIEQMEMKPSKSPKIAAQRARDARTMTELVRTLEKLDAVNRRRESKGRKTKPRDDKAIKEQFIRRLDQLLAARVEGPAAGKPESG